MAVLTFSSLLDRVLRSVRSAHCSLCPNPISNPVDAPLCADCQKQLFMRSPLPVISGASQPIYAACGFPYALKKRLYGLKFYNDTQQASLLVDVLVHYISMVPQLKERRWTVVPIPQRPDANPSHLPSLYRPVASHFGWNYRDQALVWTRETSRQHDILSRRKRRENIRGAFIANPRLEADLRQSEAVLVVDDILTTGTTLTEAMGALQQSHPNLPVFGLTLTHVPFAIGHHHE